MSYRYVTSLYYAFMTLTTVGYGDIAPLTFHERWYSIFAMLVGGFTFGLIVGSLADVVQKSDPGATVRVKALGKVHAFLHERGVPSRVTRKIRSYFAAMYEHKSVFDEVRSHSPEGPAVYKTRNLVFWCPQALVKRNLSTTLSKLHAVHNDLFDVAR
eukprot:SAG11_NODE_9767_length_882_cov_1.106003_1_plen_157_part_00